MSTHRAEGKETSAAKAPAEEKAPETASEDGGKKQARGLSDDIVDGQTLDVTIDPAKPRDR